MLPGQEYDWKTAMVSGGMLSTCFPMRRLNSLPALIPAWQEENLGGKSGSPVNMRFGKRLGALRKDRGWTYTYLSKHSGVATTFLHGLEHGTKEPCLNTIDILAKSFELSISELMRGV
jgi:DNA-binding XRE family transcriptional regulator